MTMAARPIASAARFGRSVWIWPIAAAALAAWPVWRSLFAEVPDFGVAPWRGQVALALGEVLLVGAWVLRYRERVEGCRLPLLAGAIALTVLLVALAQGDRPAADLAALSVCWLAVAFLFAGGVLLDGQRAAAATLGGAVPPVRVLSRAQERIGYGLLGLGLAAALFRGAPQGYAMAALAGTSPGAVLIWACLCDTARSILARRRVHVADLAALPALADCRSVIFAEPDMLVGRRPKLASILPMGEAKPAEIVGMAVALVSEDDGEVARGLQEFGVAHRLRVPALKGLAAGDGLRRGLTPDGRTIALGPIEQSPLGERDGVAFAEHLARAAELHRTVLALRVLEPEQRLLGLLVLAKAARPGAAEAVKSLRKTGCTVALARQGADPRDREALGALELAQESHTPSQAIGVVRPGQAPLGNTSATIHFGAGAPRAAGAESEATIARDDPRTLVDLLQFARDFRRRTRAAIIAANLPGLALLAAAVGYLPASPPLVSGAALAGFVLAVAMPQALRLSPALANHVDEE